MKSSQVFRLVRIFESDSDSPTWDKTTRTLHVGNYKPAAEYGKETKGTTSVVGIHYSHSARTNLSGSKYGQGMRGAESNRLANHHDKRISKRVHFYVDEGKGIQPERGVGHVTHGTKLHNLYDARANPHKFDQSNWSDFESKVIDSGHHGIYVSKAQGGHGVAVLLGDHHEKVPVHQFHHKHKD